MRKIIFTIFFIMCTISAFSRDLVGTGIGKSKDEARRYALDDLSQQIEVTVESLFHSKTEVSGTNVDTQAKSVVNLRANNVLLGIDYQIEEIGSEFSAKAIIPRSAMGLYERRVLDLEERVSMDYVKGINSQRISEKKGYFTEAYKNSSQAETYRNIARILGSNRNLKSEYTLAQIANQLKEIEGQALDKAVVYFQIKGNFDRESYKSHLENSLNKIIADLSNTYSGQVTLGNELFNNIIIESVLNSSHVEYIDPVFYNNKKISDAMYRASITITFTVKDTFEDRIKGSFVVSTNGRSFDNEESAMERAIGIAVRDSRHNLENYIEGYNY